MSKSSDDLVLRSVLTIRRYCRNKKKSCLGCPFFKHKGCLIGVPENWRLGGVNFSNRRDDEESNNITSTS